MNIKKYLKNKNIKNFIKSEKEDENISDIYKVFKNDEKNKKMNRITLFDRIKYIKFNKKNSGKKVNAETLKNAGLIITAVVLIGIGYSNFSDNRQPEENVVATYSKSTNNIGDVELVSSNAVLVENEQNEENNDDKQDEIDKKYENNVENAAQTSAKENEQLEEALVTNESLESISEDNQAFFSKLKMERNDMYSKSLETYQKIIDATSISNEQKAIAIQEIEKINEMQNAISVAEELIKLKGFDDVVIYENSESIAVIVRISALSTSQVAQIQNIVSKQLGVDVSKITISNK